MLDPSWAKARRPRTGRRGRQIIKEVAPNDQADMPPSSNRRTGRLCGADRTSHVLWCLPSPLSSTWKACRDPDDRARRELCGPDALNQRLPPAPCATTGGADFGLKETTDHCCSGPRLFHRRTARSAPPVAHSYCRRRTILRARQCCNSLSLLMGVSTALPEVRRAAPRKCASSTNEIMMSGAWPPPTIVSTPHSRRRGRGRRREARRLRPLCRAPTPRPPSKIFTRDAITRRRIPACARSSTATDRTSPPPS